MRQLIRSSFPRHRGMHQVFAVIIGLLTAVLYAVDALRTSPALLRRLQRGVDEQGLFDVGLLVVLGVMTGFCVVFMLYLNQLLMRRRLPELGLYRRLGMPAGRLGASLAVELLMCGVWGVGWGLLFGLLFSKLLAMMLFRLADIDQVVGVVLSITALWQVAAGMIGLLVLLGFQRLLMVQSRDVAHLKAEPVAPETEAPGAMIKFGAVCGGLMLLAATSVIIQLFAWFTRVTHLFGGTIGLGILFVVLLLAEVLGVYLLYACCLPVLLYGMMQTHWARLAKRQLLLVRLYARLRQNRQSLWLTTWLTTVTLVMLGGAAMLYQFGVATVDQDMPLAVLATNQTHAQVEQLLPNVRPVTLTTKLVSGNVKLKMRNARDAQEQGLYQVIANRDYQRIRRWQSQLPAVSVTGDQAVLLTIGRTYYQASTWSNRGRVITLPASKSQFVIKAIANRFPMGVAGYFDRGLVVSDVAFKRLAAPADTLYGYQPTRALLNRSAAQLDRLASGRQYAAIDHATLSGRKVPQITTNARRTSLGRDGLSLRRPALHEMRVVFGFVLFVIDLLGIIFLVATASILLLKQLAASFGAIKKRQTLLRLGMPRRDAEAIIYAQTLGVFGLPLVVGSFNAGLGIYLLRVVLDGTPSVLVIVAFAVYTCVYLGFAMATAVRSNQQ